MLRILKTTLLTLLALLLVLWLLLQTPAFQSWLVQTATKRLSEAIGTEVTIKHASIGWLNRVSLEGVMLKDKKQDTIVSIGRLQVNTTDWLVFKDTVVLKYIALKNVQVKLYRDDTTWNYAFLSKSFGGSNESVTPKTNNPSTNPIVLQLETLEIDNLRFRQADRWKGKTLVMSVKHLQLQAEKIDLNQQVFAIESLVIQKPEYREIRRNGKWSISDSVAYYRRVDSLDRLRNFPESWNPGNMQLTIRKLQLIDGEVEIFNRHGMRFKRGEFEENDIIITPITGTLANVRLLHDTLTADVKLTAKERSGLEVKKLDTKFTLHPQLMEFDKLDLQLNDSRMGPYFAMRYTAIDRMEYFIDSVHIAARLKDSRVSMSDITFFAPELKGINQVATLSGVANGTVADFEVKDVDLRTGRSRLTGNYSMKGLTDIDNTVISFETKGSKIALEDVAVWAPDLKDLKNTPVDKLGVLNYTGNFKGTAYDFVAKGQLQTDVGRANTSVSVRLKGKGAGFNASIYNATINAGKLLDVPDLGLVNFDGNVASNWLSAAQPLSFKGNIESLVYGTYQYHALKIEGEFSNNKMAAAITAADPNLTANINTILNFKDSNQRYNATGAVAYANLQQLGFTKDSITFSGLFDVDFRGRKIDDFVGYARVYETELYDRSDLLNVDSFYIGSTIDSLGIKELLVMTNEAEIKVNGKFNFSDLRNGFQGWLHQYYPSLIPLPKRVPKNQDFSFSATTNNIEPFLHFIDPKIRGLNNSNISGRLNNNTGELLVDIDAPYFEYDGINISNTKINAKGGEKSLALSGTIDNLRFNDSIGFPGVKLNINTNNDTTQLQLTTFSNGPLGNAAVNGFFYSKPDGYEIAFEESSIIINNKKWTLSSNGSIALKNGYLIANGVNLSNYNQRIKLHTQPSDEGNWNNLYADISEFSVGDILPFVMKEPRLEGLLSGQVVVEDPMGKPNVRADLRMQQFYFNNDSVGVVTFSGSYNSSSQLMDAIVDSRNPSYDFDGRVKVNLQKGATDQLDARLNLRKESIGVLNNYLEGILAEMKGFASGQLRIVGSFSSPSIIGELQLSKASVKVGYTQCVYTIENGKLKFGDNFLNFGSLELKDVAGRKGSLEGIMYHRFFDSLSFNMRMRTEGMQVLNTTSRDNDLFYGNAVAKASFDLTGPLNNLRMRIIGTTSDTSKIVIANKTGKESGEADFIRFKSYGTEMVQNIDTSVTNIHISLDLTATPICKIDVVMDEITGDVISASGNGNLRITAGSTDPTVMRGRFQIERGSYNYSFQTLIKKPFELEGGESNYIEWNGDPYDAKLNVSARYRAANVSLRDLMGSEQGRTVLDQSAQNYKGDVYVKALVQGMLSNPRLTFDIEFPPGSPMQNNVSAQSMLTQIKADNSEMLRQVTYLIVFKQFAPYKEGIGTRNPGADLAINTLSDLLSTQMGRILTSVVQDITGDRSINVDISTELYNSSSLVGGNVNSATGYDRVNFNFMLNRSYFNNRIVVNLGSDFDLNMRNTTAAGFQFLPDVSIEFILTQNRRLRAILFKKDNLDFAGRRNRAGVSLSYRKDFDKLFSSEIDEGLFFMRKSEN